MTKRCLTALLPLLMGALTGCMLIEEGKAPSLWQSKRSTSLDGSHAIIEVALIESPFGDRFVNQELWNQIDELVVDLEKRSNLEDNGFRVGQLVGTPSNRFLGLLLSKRSCNNPHALLLPPGKTAPIYLSSILAQTNYEIIQGKQKKQVELDQARFCFDVTPTVTPQGQLKIAFTPKVENGETQLPFEQAADGSGWTLRVDRPCKKYPELGWEVTLGTNQYLIVGCRLDRDDSLGYHAFIQEEGSAVQRLLVIRNGTSTRPLADGSIEEYLNAQCPPLALQATLPTARAKTH